MAYKIDRWTVHDDGDALEKYCIKQMLNALTVMQEAADQVVKSKTIPLLDQLHAVEVAIKNLDNMLARGVLSNVTSDQTGRNPVLDAKDHMEALLMLLKVQALIGSMED